MHALEPIHFVLQGVDVLVDVRHLLQELLQLRLLVEPLGILDARGAEEREGEVAGVLVQVGFGLLDRLEELGRDPGVVLVATATIFQQVLNLRFFAFPDLAPQQLGMRLVLPG